MEKAFGPNWLAEFTSSGWFSLIALAIMVFCFLRIGHLAAKGERDAVNAATKEEGRQIQYAINAKLEVANILIDLAKIPWMHREIWDLDQFIAGRRTRIEKVREDFERKFGNDSDFHPRDWDGSPGSRQPLYDDLLTIPEFCFFEIAARPPTPETKDPITSSTPPPEGSNDPWHRGHYSVDANAAFLLVHRRNFDELERWMKGLEKERARVRSDLARFEKSFKSRISQ
ncbi:MAG: hypothetical protein COA68_17345 [Oceanobacter sp.]|nr:MAG: hypothetical protein COA68_17345 [Oceanobacter sp.]